MVGVISLPLLWYASAGEAVFWWIVISSMLIVGHALNLEKISQEDDAELVENNV